MRATSNGAGNLNKLHDWIGYYDRMMAKIDSGIEWDLLGYLPYAVVPWYAHMAAPANSAKPTEWPKADYEVRIIHLAVMIP